MIHPYYAARAAQIAADFRESLRLAAPAFASAAPGLDLDALWPDVAVQLDDVIAALPWVGGHGGRMTGYFEQNAGVIALGSVLIAQGLPKPTVAQLLQRTFLAHLGAMDREARAALGLAPVTLTLAHGAEAQIRQVLAIFTAASSHGPGSNSWIRQSRHERIHVLELRPPWHIKAAGGVHPIACLSNGIAGWSWCIGSCKVLAAR